MTLAVRCPNQTIVLPARDESRWLLPSPSGSGTVAVCVMQQPDGYWVALTDDCPKPFFVTDEETAGEALEDLIHWIEDDWWDVPLDTYRVMEVHDA